MGTRIKSVILVFFAGNHIFYDIYYIVCVYIIFSNKLFCHPVNPATHTRLLDHPLWWLRSKGDKPVRGEDRFRGIINRSVQREPV